MKIRELRAAIAGLPDDADFVIQVQDYTEGSEDGGYVSAYYEPTVGEYEHSANAFFLMAEEE